MVDTKRAPTTGQLCSAFSRSAEEDPRGSATSFDVCVVIEVPKPWDGDVVTSRHFPASAADAVGRATQRGRQAKLLCVVPDAEYTEAGHSRVMFFSRPYGPFATYVKSDFEVPSDEVEVLVETFLAGPNETERFDPYRQDTSDVRDILVCTHGSRDRCCASFGFPVYQVLRHQYGPASGGALRVWQASHIGGHRFAPNILDLPEGRNWVRAHERDLDTLVLRTDAPSQVKHLYRGWAGLATPFEQVVEVEALSREGWGWTGRLVQGHTVSLEADGARAEVRLDYSGNGTSGAFEAVVERTADLPTIDCLTGADKEPSPQYSITNMTRVG